MSIYYILKELSKSKGAEIIINLGKNCDLSSIISDENIIINLIWSYDDIRNLLQNTIYQYGWSLTSHKKEQVYAVHNITYYLTNECSATITEEFVDWSLLWKSKNIVLGAYPIRKRAILSP